MEQDHVARPPGELHHRPEAGAAARAAADPQPPGARLRLAPLCPELVQLVLRHGALRRQVLGDGAVRARDGARAAPARRPVVQHQQHDGALERVAPRRPEPVHGEPRSHVDVPALAAEAAPRHRLPRLGRRRRAPLRNRRRHLGVLLPPRPEPHRPRRRGRGGGGRRVRRRVRRGREGGVAKLWERHGEVPVANVEGFAGGGIGRQVPVARAGEGVQDGREPRAPGHLRPVQAVATRRQLDNAPAGAPRPGRPVAEVDRRLVSSFAHAEVRALRWRVAGGLQHLRRRVQELVLHLLDERRHHRGRQRPADGGAAVPEEGPRQGPGRRTVRGLGRFFPHAGAGPGGGGSCPPRSLGHLGVLVELRLGETVVQTRMGFGRQAALPAFCSCSLVLVLQAHTQYRRISARCMGFSRGSAPPPPCGLPPPAPAGPPPGPPRPRPRS